MLREGSNFGRAVTLLSAAVLAYSAWAAAFQPAAAARPREPRTIEEWHEGPVRYLMNRTETREFRRLETNSERVAFIRRFWDRRDPDPRTPANEARLVFWQRVAESNRKFGDTPLPGWKTDRGKIFILLGPPNDVERNLEFDTKIRTEANRGLLRWHYHGLRQAATRAITVVAFVQTGDGDWRLTADPKLSSPFLNLNSLEAEGAPSTLSNLVEAIPWAGGSLGTAMDLGRLQEVPSERALLRAAVRAEEFLGTYEGRATVHPVAGPSGERFAAVTIAVARESLSPPWDGSAVGIAQRFAVSAQFKPSDESSTALPVELPEEAFVAEPAPPAGDPWIRFQAIRPVPPGSWRLSAVVLDREGGGAATVYRSIDLPEFDPARPRIDGPVLAAAVLEAGSERAAGRLPFRMRDRIVVPRMEPVLGPDDPFSLYVEVFPPPGLDVPVRLEWQLYRAPPDGVESPFGPRGLAEDGRGPRAWELPAGAMPPGTYRAVFVASVEGAVPLTREISFDVRAPAEPR